MSHLTHYAAQEDGRHNIGVSIGETITVLVTPHSAAAQADAEQVAALIDDHVTSRRHDSEALAACRDSLALALSRAASVEAAIDAVMLGKRRFFGRVLMKPATPGAWSGPVWLLDPDKQENGLGLRFESTMEVRHSFPELWVIGMTSDGVLLDVAQRPEGTP